MRPQTTLAIDGEVRARLAEKAAALGLHHGEGGNVSLLLRQMGRGQIVPVPREDLLRLIKALPDDDPMQAKLHTLLQLD